MCVAAAIVGSAAIGAVASSSASNKASKSADKATAAQQGIADDQTALGQQQLDFDKQVYAEGRPLRDQAAQTAISVSRSQQAAQDQQTRIAADYDAYNKGTYRPLEQKIVSDARGYDTAGRRMEAIAGATSDVEQAYANANASQNRAMQRDGVTPGSGRMQSLMADQTIAKANALAGATTGAVRNVETVGAARMADAANLGRNLPSNQAVAANTAINAGNSAANNSMQAVAAQQAGVGNVNAGYQGAIAANNSAGSLYGQAMNSYNSVANANAGALGGIGSAIGMAGANGAFKGLGTTLSGWGGAGGAKANPNAGYYAGVEDYGSDEKIKSGTDKPIDTAQALKGIEDTPVKSGWKYDAGKGGPDDGGQPHDGPMAQAVAKNMGRDVAPGGKKIDIASMNGRMLGGMQELAKRVKKLERRAA